MRNRFPILGHTGFLRYVSVLTVLALCGLVILLFPSGSSSDRESLLRPPFARNGGFAYRVPVPGRSPFDSAAEPDASRILLLEDDRLIGDPHTAHVTIRTQGAGNFSHWNGALYFSTSDNSDPNTNGRNP